MAQKVSVSMVCDLPHDGEVEGTETVRFALGNTAYELDVCSPHAKEIRESFGIYTEHARKAGRGSAGGPARRTRATGSSNGRARSQDIRAWAKTQNIFVSDRGRVPADVASQYDAAHGAS